MFLRKISIHLNNLRPSVTKLAENSFLKKNKTKSRSILIFPTVVLGTIIYENHEDFFSMMGLSQSKLKKRIDRWKGIEDLDKTIDLNISHLNLLNEEDYLIKVTQPPNEKPNSENLPLKEIDNNSENSEYSELLKISEEIQVKFKNEIELNKKNLILNLIENEELLDNLKNEKKNLLNQIKSEKANQNKIIELLKDKLSKDEFSNLETIRQILNEEKLQTEHLNMINLVLPHGDNYKSLNASIEDLNKLTDQYNKTNDQLVNLNSEISSLNESLKKLDQLEEVYKTQINTFKIIPITLDKNIIINPIKETESVLEKLPQSQTEDQNLLVINCKLFENMKVLYNQIIKANNKKNLEQLNGLYSNLKIKLITIFEATNDEFSLEILKNSTSQSNRIYSHIEIENAFEAIKRDLFYEILLNHFGSIQYLKPVSPYLSKFFSGIFVNSYLNKYDPCECDIQESDSDDKKYLKALNFLADNIKYRKYPEAYKSLQYFKNKEKLIADLSNKLEVMTRESFAIDTLKTHLI